MSLLFVIIISFHKMHNLRFSEITIKKVIITRNKKKYFLIIFYGHEGNRSITK